MFFIGIALIALGPLFIPGIAQGFDWSYHILRVESIKQGLLASEFPVKIHSLPIDGYGYASGIFYPQVFLYIPAFFRVMGMSIDAANKLFFVLVMAARTFTTYFSSKYISKSKYVAVCTTTLFILSPVVFFKLYIAFSYSDNIGYIFAPLIMCGVYNYLYEDFNKPYLIGVGFLGLFLSHLISTVFMFIAVVMMLVVNCKIVFKNIENFFKLCITAVCVLLLSAFFWVPMVEQLVSDKFYVSVPWSEFLENSKLFKQILKYGSEYVSTWLLIAVVLVALLIIIVMFILLFKKLNKVDAEFNFEGKKMSVQLLALTAFCFVAMTEFFPWPLLVNVLGFIQFPGRFIYLVEMFLAFGLPIGLNLFLTSRSQKKKSVIWMCAVCIVINSVITFFLFKSPRVITYDYLMDQTHVNDETMEYDGDRIFRYDIGWGKEYIPLDTNLYLLNRKDTVISNNGTEIYVDRRGSTLKFSPIRGENVKFFDLPILYYKGYKAVAVDDCGNELSLTVEKGNNNTVRVLCDKSDYSQIKVSYTGTLVRKVAEFVSLFSVIIFFIVHMRFYKKVIRKDDRGKSGLLYRK